MATTVHVPIEQYFETIDRKPTTEYVGGELVQRALPSYTHGKTQVSFATVFRNAGRRHPLFACTETHMRIGPTTVRIPDVAVFVGAEPAEPIPSEPAGVVVEILSPSDSWSDVMSRFRELHEWGVRHIWLADPEARAFYVYDGGDVKLAQKLELPEYGVSIGPDDVF